MAGLGVAGRAFLPAILSHVRFELAGVCDPRDDTLASVPDGVHRYRTVEEMCADSRIEVVYVATPTELHADHAVLALSSGMHAIVEKPIALALHEAEDMVASAEGHRAALVVGHTQAFEPGVREIRSLVEAGEVGAVRSVSMWHHTDWACRRARAEHENVVLRQGAHQIDVIRETAGAVVDAVRARVYDTGFSAFLDLAQGVPATVVYRGDGHLVDQEGDKALAPAFGHTVVSCDHADLELSAAGLVLHRGGRPHLVPIDRWPDGRTAVLDEMWEAVFHEAPPHHDGQWGKDTLAACLAIIESAERGVEVEVRG